MTKFILDTRITGEPCQWLYILFWKVMILQERKFIHSVCMKEADCQIRRVILKKVQEKGIAIHGSSVDQAKDVLERWIQK